MGMGMGDNRQGESEKVSAYAPSILVRFLIL